MRYLSVILALALCFSLNQMALAKILFEDDFEQDEIGDEDPSKWECNPDEMLLPGKILEDPIEGDKCLGDFDASNTGGYLVPNSLEWTDYIAEWDWMFTRIGENDSVSFRINPGDGAYYFSKRSDFESIKVYKNEGGQWSEVGTGGTFPVDLEVWYRAQLKVEGDTFTGKLKEKTDPTPFSEIEPTFVGTDTSFEKGGFALSYYGPIDDVLIVESEADLVAAVDHASNLAATWGSIKNR